MGADAFTVSSHFVVPSDICIMKLNSSQMPAVNCMLLTEPDFFHYSFAITELHN